MIHCNACISANAPVPRSKAICICEYFAQLKPVFKEADPSGGEALTFQEFEALANGSSLEARACLEAFDIHDPCEVQEVFEDALRQRAAASPEARDGLELTMLPEQPEGEGRDESIFAERRPTQAISAQELLAGLAARKGMPRNGIWPAPPIKAATRSRLPAEDAPTWSSLKDLHQYKVDSTVAVDDPDWLKHNEGHPEYDKPWRSPKALRGETLQLWRPEKLRPARPRDRSYASSTGFLEAKSKSSTAIDSCVDTWTKRTAGGMAMSERTIAAFGGSKNWSTTVRAKLHPLQLSKGSSSTSSLPAQASKALPKKSFDDSGVPRFSASLVWKNSDEAFVEKFGLGKDPSCTLFQRSITKFGYSDRGDAQESLEKAIAFDPRNSLGFRQRGVVQLADHDYDAVIANCTEALRLDPTHAATWSRRADAKLMKGDFKGAKADIDDAICRDVGVPRFWNTRSFIKFKMGDLDGSLRDSDKAVRLDPTVADHWSGRASCKVRVEDWKGAEEDSISAIGLDTHNLTAWVARAAARNGLSNFRGAVSDCDQALRLDSLCLQALTHRGFAKCNLGDFTGAETDCKHAIAISPTYAPAWCTLGEAKFQQAWVNDGNKGPLMEEALKDFDEALRIEPEHARAWWYRGKLLLSIGRYKAARDDIAHAYYLEPRWDDARKDMELCDKYIKTTSAWNLPLVQRGLGGDIALGESIKRAERKSLV